MATALQNTARTPTPFCSFLNPSLFPSMLPQSSGQWVGCVAVDAGGDWMVCAGSMAPSIYRLTSNNKIASLPVPPHVATQAAIFTKDRVSFFAKL